MIFKLRAFVLVPALILAWALAGCLAAAAGGGAFAGYAWKDKERNAGQILRDGKTTNVLKTRLITSKKVHSGKINVDTHLMHVILAGTVPCQSDKVESERIARKVKGVVHVENILVVKRKRSVNCKGGPPAHNKGKGKAKGHKKK